MPRGAARSSGSSGEDILHFNAVRVRVNGEGNLKLKLVSLDNLRSQQLEDIPMSNAPGMIPTVLSNFIEQRCALQGGTISINDYFKINRIVIFSKFFASSFPQ